MNKFLNFIKSKYVIYSAVVFIYLCGVIGMNILDSILVDAGECFSVAWNVLSAWAVVRFFQKRWLVQLNKTRFFNLYMLLGLLVILVNFVRYLGTSDFHSPMHSYIVAFLVSFGTAFAEEVVLRALTNETFKGENNTFKKYKLIIIVSIFILFTFFKEFLSAYFVNLVNKNIVVDELLLESYFWEPILNSTVFAGVFGFFLFTIYRKTNLSTCVIISVLYFLFERFTLLTVSETYLPDTVGDIVMIINYSIMLGSGLFFTFYNKKLPQNLEYEEKEGAKEIEE